MKTPGVLLAAGLAAATACSSSSSPSSTPRTSVVYDRTVNFSKYRTFSYLDVQRLHDELVGRRVHQALTDALEARGLQENNISPDLWFAPHVRLTRETEISTYDAAWGYSWRWRRNGMSVEPIAVGTLIVDLVDATRMELVWRATATDTFGPEASATEKEEALSRAIAKMLESFPPKS